LKYGTWLKNSKGIEKNEVVAMNFTNKPTFLWIWFGLWSIGATPACINHNLREEPLLHCVRACGTRLIVIDEAVHQTYPEKMKNDIREQLMAADEDRKSDIVLFDSQIEKQILDLQPTNWTVEPKSGAMLEQPAMLIFTSGTTGLPKAAIMSWNKCRFGSNLLQRWVGFRSDDVVYTVC
jgi:acyl-CoA synthetase (AMP-forming)/AMP-acid ligase II